MKYHDKTFSIPQISYLVSKQIINNTTFAESI